MKFYVGLHHPDKAHHFERCCISIHRLTDRQRMIQPREWIMDSGAFTTISKHGGYPQIVGAYAMQIDNWADQGKLQAAVAQDFMCEPAMLERTGLTVADHQRLTIARYRDLLSHPVISNRRRPVHIMPVLQGYAVDDYARHVRDYGELLAPGAWVGVGSVCKRNRAPAEIARVLQSIKALRPDLRLHGFGVKLTALRAPAVRDLLHSADSMAWSFAARREGRDANDWREALAWAARVDDIATGPSLLTASN